MICLMRTLTIVVGIVVVAIVGYVVWAERSDRWPFGTSDTVREVPGDWKTYTSTAYGFEVHYPPTAGLIGTLETRDSATIVVDTPAAATSQNSISFGIRPVGQ